MDPDDLARSELHDDEAALGLTLSDLRLIKIHFCDRKCLSLSPALFMRMQGKKRLQEVLKEHRRMQNVEQWRGDVRGRRRTGTEQVGLRMLGRQEKGSAVCASIAVHRALVGDSLLLSSVIGRHPSTCASYQSSPKVRNEFRLCRDVY